MHEKIYKGLQIFLPLILGSLVGLLINSSMDYANLNQPPLRPHGIVFPIAWSILYLLMGIGYYLYRQDYKDNKTIVLYYLNLFFNLTWTFIFFVFKLRGLSILWIIILIGIVLLLIKEFWQTKRASAYCFIPYLLWLIFATYLNIGIFILN